MPEPKRELLLRRFLPYRLSVLSNVVSRTIADMYAEEFGISVWQWRIMAVLGEEEGPTAQVLAQKTAMDKVTVSRAATALIGKGLVRRKASPSDGRAAHLFLTAAGRRMYEEIVPRALGYEKEFISGLTAKERETLDALLAKLQTRANALDASASE